MKRIIILFVGALAALFSSCFVFASAQEATPRPDGYKRLVLSYECQDGDFELEGELPAKGLSVGFVRGVLLGGGERVALEFGGKLAWTHGVDKDWGYNISRRDFLSAVLPVNVSYRLRLAGGNLVVAPYLGPTFRFNIVGRHDYEVWGHAHSVNFLSRREDTPASIFQFGGNVGIGFCLRGLYVGYAYQHDFTAYAERLRSLEYPNFNGEFRTRNHVVSVGFEF